MSAALKKQQIQIEDFILHEVLGEGATSVVYRGTHQSDSSKVVAIKIAKEKIDDENIERRLGFENEAELLYRLSHPGIVKLIKYGLIDGYPYLVMEHAAGKLLSEVHNMSYFEVAEVLRQIGLSLAHAHTKGILHRDIKPSNIVVNKDNSKLSVKLFDFGLGGGFASENSAMAVGTLHYIAPEHLGHWAASAGVQSDLYSAGMLAVELLHGKHPFKNLSARELIEAQLHQTPGVPETTPEALAGIIKLLIKKDPTLRYQTAQGMVNDLESFLTRAQRGDLTPFELKCHDHRRELGSPKFFGRLRERELIWSAFEDAKRGDTQIVTLGGRSGMGKSRLIREVARRWARSHVLSGIGRAYGQGSAYAIFAQILADLVKQKPSERTKNKIREVVGELAHDLMKLAPEFKTLLAEIPVYIEIEPERRQQRFFSVVTNLLKALGSADAPLVLILDDLQWADEGSLQLISLLCRQSHFHCLLILSYRSDEVNARLRLALSQINTGTKSDSQIELVPLAPDEIRVLQSDMLGESIPAIEELVVSQAQGSPLFAVELIHSLVEVGALVVKDERWVFENPEKLEFITLNEGLAATILSRLERFSSEKLQVLQLASVVGRGFSFRDLIDVLPFRLKMEKQACGRLILETLREATLARLIESSSDSDDYSFSHDKIRESLYERLETAEKSLWHSLVGQALLRTSSPTPELQFALAHHFLHSDDHAKAMLYAVSAGNLAIEHLAHRQAIELFDQALGRSSFIPVSQEMRHQIQESTADAASMLGEYLKAIENYKARLEQENNIEARIRVLIKLGTTFVAKGEIHSAAQVLEETLGLMGESLPQSFLGHIVWFIRGLFVQFLHTWFPKKRAPTSDPKRLQMFRIYGQLTRVYYYLDSFKSVALHLQHMNAIENENHLLAMAEVYSYHGPALLLIPNYTRALKYVLRSLAIYQELGDQLGAARTRFYSMVTYGGSARWQEAIREGQIGEAALEKLGDRWYLVSIMFNMGIYYTFYGDWNQAQRYAERVQRISTEMNYQIGLVYAGWLASLISARIDNQKLKEEATLVLESVLSSGDYVAMCQAYMVLGWSYYRLDDLEKALEMFEKGLVIKNQHRLGTSYVLRLEPSIIDTLLTLRQKTRDPDTKEKLLSKAEKLFATSKRRVKKYPNYRAEAFRQEGLLLAARGKMTAASKSWQKALSLATEQHFIYQKGLICREWGLALLEIDKVRSENLLAQAAAVFRQLRARADLKTIEPLISPQVLNQSSVDIPNDWSFRSSTLSDKTLKSTRRELDALLHIGLASVGSNNPKDQINLILDEVIQLLHAERAFLFMVNKTTSTLLPMSGRDSHQKDLPQLTGFSSTVVNRVFMDNESVILTGDEDSSQSVIVNSLKSIIALPLRVRDITTGVVYLDSSAKHGLFSQEDIEILSAICSHIAITFEATQIAHLEAERREMAKDLELTGVVQRLFLPAITECETKNWKLCGTNRAAAQCSGDWWWYKENPSGHLTAIIGDVTGHGAAPAMITASVATMVKACIDREAGLPVDVIMEITSRALFDIAKGEYLMCAAALHCSPGRLQLWMAGNPPVALLRKSGKLEWLIKAGSPMGFVPFQLGYLEAPTEPGDRIMLFSDGITEMLTASGNPLGERRLGKMFIEEAKQEISAVLTNIFTNLDQKRGNQAILDDWTMLLIEIKF